MRVQYIYTFGIFFSALATAFLMMSRESRPRNSRDFLWVDTQDALRSESSQLDPGLRELFRAEDNLRNHNAHRQSDRLPTATSQGFAFAPEPLDMHQKLRGSLRNPDTLPPH